MSTVPSDVPVLALTPEQARVVDLPPEAMTLVTAGPGSGKTHTLTARLVRLVEKGVEPADILVLTFSRNAVAELRRRLRAHPTTRGLRVSTFDAWALELLRDVDGAENWTAKKFDQRVVAAREAIDEELADNRYEENLRHVVVDEIQDLVGVRRELVQTLLARYDCGFTVVGDLAQSIYGFQIDDMALRRRETGQFVRWLREEFKEELQEAELTENHRARNADVRVALPFGARLRRPEDIGDGRELRMELRAMFSSSVEEIGTLSDGLVQDYLRSTVPTAVLCRTNGEALLVSEALHGAGVPHELRRDARDRSVPAWVAELFGSDVGRKVDRDRFAALAAAQHSGAAGLDDLWVALLRVAGDSADRALDVRRLRGALAGGRAPDELTAQSPATLIVSSFHRAKGLEFDRVVIVEPSDYKRENEDHAEECRLLFVALTRSRSEIGRLLPLQKWSARKDKRTGRWSRPGPAKWMRRGIEMIGGDVCRDHPAGTAEFMADPVVLQARIRDCVRPGDPVVLEKGTVSLTRGESPNYLVLHNEAPIGIVSAPFRSDLHRMLVWRPRDESYVPRFPLRVESLFVDAVETVVGSEASGSRAGLGDHGVWLAPRLTGLGSFVGWDPKQEAAR